MSVGIDTQVQFATEFALFLVAVAGVALALLRPELLTRSQPVRLALVSAFAALAGAAVLHGSLLIEDPADPTVLSLRAIGWLALLAGALRWDGGRWSQRLVAVAFALGVAELVTTLVEAETGAAVVRAGAAVAAGGALLQASRRAIAARVAASAAATLLLVVLVLSVGLSAVLTNTVENQAIASVDGRAVREASLIEGARVSAIRAASFTSNALVAASEVRPVLVAINDAGAVTVEQREQLERILDGLVTSNFLGDNIALAYVDSRAGVIATAALPDSVFVELVGTDAAAEAVSTRLGTGDVVSLGDRAIALGVNPVSDTGGRSLGLLLVALQVDNAYLEDRARAEEAVSLSLWSRTGEIAEFGKQPPAAGLAALTSEVLGGEEGTTDTVESQFVAARAVRSQTNQPLLALIASRPTTAVDDVRERLFRTFFVIAFGGTLLALLLAALVGDRIGAGIRRLTRSAEALERGEPDVRSGVQSEDEIGRLGAAFDSMAASIEEKTGALRQAALDEATLRNRLEAVVAGMGEALVAVDDGGAITDFNEAAEDLLGVAAVDAKGKPVRSVIRLRNEEGVDLGDRLTSTAQDRWSDVAEVEGAAGGAVPVAVTAGPLRTPDGETAGRVLVLRDLRTEREVERMKREFLSRVGHELRTPLTPLLGYARILAGRDMPSERARELASNMISSGERLERIVEMLEFFASAQAGRNVLRPEVVDVRDLLGRVVDAHEHAAANGHTVVRRVAAKTPSVIGDAYWLRRSIEELVDNAIKFSPSGGRVSVTAAPAGDAVEIAVRDTGVGMSPDEVERAFAEWSQGDESDTRAYGGLGLGLALVQRVAERHGGRVTCETAPGKGAKFSILLPAVPTEDGDAATPRARGSRRTRRGGDGGVPDS